MTVSMPTDDELALVADVAVREGWADLSAPPATHGARSLEEQLAIARFEASVPTRGRSERALRLRARLAIAALTIGVLGVCWWVSPTRTAIGLVGAGVFSLIAVRRSRRRHARDARPRRLI
ncbi:MAG: hypothetical protein AB7G65_13650 [Thermoleophilia bacterium]